MIGSNGKSEVVASSRDLQVTRPDGPAPTITTFMKSDEMDLYTDFGTEEEEYTEYDRTSFRRDVGDPKLVRWIDTKFKQATTQYIHPMQYKIRDLLYVLHRRLIPSWRRRGRGFTNDRRNWCQWVLQRSCVQFLI